MKNRFLLFLGIGICFVTFAAVIRDKPLTAYQMVPSLITASIGLVNFFRTQRQAELAELQQINLFLEQLLKRLD